MTEKNKTKLETKTKLSNKYTGVKSTIGLFASEVGYKVAENL